MSSRVGFDGVAPASNQCGRGDVRCLLSQPDGCEELETGRKAAHEEANMAAMKPRTGDGPLEVTKEGRGLVMRVPLEGGGRLVVELSADEASALGDALHAAVA